MKKEVALTDDVDLRAKTHLLAYFEQGVAQENLCFGLWFPSKGRERFTAVVNELVFPNQDEIGLHGNASFEGKYLTRATREAKRQKAGLVMMHSHPSSGWQDLSQADVFAERDVVAYQAQATKQPFLGMTIGSDGYWSARFWTPESGSVKLEWCSKIRVPRKERYLINWNPAATTRYSPTPLLQRTIETWGVGVQEGIQRLRIGIVGVGSVGSIVAESLARLGVTEVVLIDPDRLEAHNLDRFIFGTRSQIGEFKVRAAKQAILQHSTFDGVKIREIPLGIEYKEVFQEALDCDLLFSCVDRPVARDVLNYIGISNAIPVVEGGVAVEVRPGKYQFESARWRSHLVIPGNACLRCTGQYSSSDVVAELDGSLDNPSYISSLPENDRPQSQNVFPFSLGCASLQVNMMIRYLIGEQWWPRIQRQEYRVIAGETRRTNAECREHCAFRLKEGLGTSQVPSYLKGGT